MVAYLNLDQDVATKRERGNSHIVAKPYYLYQAVEMGHYGSLININPSILTVYFTSCLFSILKRGDTGRKRK